MIQIRISEVLMLMAFIDKKYAPVWCLAVSSRTASALRHDGRCIRHSLHSGFSCGDYEMQQNTVRRKLWPVLCNAFIGIELYLFGSPLLLSMATVAFGEFLSVSVLGYVLFRQVLKNSTLVERLKIA